MALLTTRLLARVLLLLACGPLACLSVAAQGSSWVRIVVPAPVGGNLDTIGRKLAQRLTVLTGEPHVVENRPGANTQIGTEAVARAPADGRTMLYAGTSIVFLAQVQKLAFSPLEDLAPVVQVTRESYVLVTAAGSRATLDKLPSFAAAKAGGVDCVTSAGLATMACEQLRARLGGRLTIVPYGGVSPSLNALLSGVGDVLFVNTSAALPLVEAGRLRVLAVSRRQGQPTSVAGAPLLSDVWPGFVIDGLSGLFVPARTPSSRIDQINGDVRRVMAEPEVAALAREGGQELVGGSAEQFAEVMAHEQRRFTQVIQSLGLGVK